jgi:hypothetical protein
MNVRSWQIRDQRKFCSRLSANRVRIRNGHSQEACRANEPPKTIWFGCLGSHTALGERCQEGCSCPEDRLERVALLSTRRRED